MPILSSRSYFLGLALIATILLWGVSLWNGTVKALIVATTTARFEDQTALKTDYTGVYVLDFPLCLLVAFFFYGTNGTNNIYQLFLIDAYGSLQVAFIWLYVEGSRKNEKKSTLANPIIWGLLWQAFGGAISLPLYYLNHLDWLRLMEQRVGPVSLADARALPISFAFGAILPALIGMLPMWVNRSALAHQNILAAWQLDPFWVSVCQAATAMLFSRLQFRTKKDEQLAVWWTRASYLMAATCSAISHLYAVTSIISLYGSVALIRAYIPSLCRGSSGMDERLVSGPWLFLQYDLMIIALSSLSWVYVLVKDLVHDIPFATIALPLTLAAAGLVLGPGTAVSVTLFWREGILQQERAKANRSPKSKLVYE